MRQCARTQIMTANTYYTKRETKWRNNIDTVATELDSKHFGKTSLENELTLLVDTALEHSHSNWKPGADCPECGSKEQFRWVSYDELTRHENNNRGFIEGANTGKEYGWECVDCETPIFISPASLLIPDAPENMCGNNKIETLRNAILEHVPTTEWTPGDSCSVCDSEFIWETPLDVYPVTVNNNRYEQGMSGERITTGTYSCDCCGETLFQTPWGYLSACFSV